ncbi:MAG: aminodeoxychorismate/anthranilate synthase component II [Bacillales bacterium]
MILLVDYGDSFIFNLFQYLGELGEEAAIIKGDETLLQEIGRKAPDAVILSSGPCRPEKAASSSKIVLDIYKSVPILGISFGHLVIGRAFGAKLKPVERPMQGKMSLMTHEGKGLFASLNSPLEVMRYHSHVIDKNSLPDCLEAAGFAEDDGELMAIRHKQYPVFGLQFHPESIGTEFGKKMLENFLKITRGGEGK